MNSNGSILSTIITRVRGYLDETDVDAKYPDDYMLRHYVMPSMVDVLARLNLNQENPVVNRLDMTLLAEQREFVLPPCIQAVLMLAIHDSNGLPVCEIKPRSIFDWMGRGFSLEGNILRLGDSQPTYTTDSTMTLWYISNGDVHPHLSTGGGTLALNGTTGKHEFTLGTASLGQIDRRVNGYAGQTLRLLPASPAPTEERVIESSSHAGGVWKVVLRNKFTDTAPASNIPYEIAPPQSQALAEAVALLAAQKAGVPRKINQTQAQALLLQYRAAMKTIGDNLSLIQQRTFKQVAKTTMDRGWGPLAD